MTFENPKIHQTSTNYDMIDDLTILFLTECSTAYCLCVVRITLKNMQKRKEKIKCQCGCKMKPDDNTLFDYI